MLSREHNLVPHLVVSGQTGEDEADPGSHHCDSKHLGDKDIVHQVQDPLQLLVLSLEGMAGHHVPEHVEDGHGEGEHLHLHLPATVGQDVLHQAACLSFNHHFKILLAEAKVAKVLHSKVSLTGPPFALSKR